jgi:4-hydroxymandelate oxidase
VIPLLAAQEAAARDRLPPGAHAYVATGAGDEVSLAEATAAWASVRLRPRVLRDVSAVDTGATLLGCPLPSPVGIAPTAAHALVHPAAETGTAQGAGGRLYVASTRSTTRFEDLGATGPWWVQAYVMRDRGLTRALVQRAAALGASAVVLTGDTPFVPVRTRSGGGLADIDVRVNLEPHPQGAADQDPSVGLEAIGELAEASGLPVLVKGVLRADDARDCVAAGAAGLDVSNHGGRQLDRAVATAVALPEVAGAVDVPVLVDGGVRSGTDVLCALALGASAVLLGRPVLWALAAGGADGVRDCLDAVDADLRSALALAGCPDLAAADRSLVAH